MKNKIIAALTAIACFGLLAGHATEASAQATRTWVSGVGDDVNPCSRTAPCKTFAGAISKTADGGIIDVLDPGGFGAVTITKGITIRSTAEGGGILASATNGVVINAPGKTVSLINLQIDGNGSTTGVHGVNVLAAAQVNIEGCKIHTFRNAGAGAGNGIRLAAAGGVRVTVKDSFIYDNLVGINIVPPAAAASNRMLIDNVVIDGNATAAIAADAAATLLVVSRSTMIQAINLTNGAVFRSYSNNSLPPTFSPTENVPQK